MKRTLISIRIFFLILCMAGSWLLAYTIPEWDSYRWLAMTVGMMIGVLVILVDVFLKGFSLRGLSAITFGLAIGGLVAYLISSSPLLERGDDQTIFLVRLALFVICFYLGAVLALRGKDEFNLVIPYVRFVPHDVEVPLVVVDASALIDGRIARICETHFFHAALVVPSFVIDEINRIASSPDPVRRSRGRRGLEVLNELRQIRNVDIRVHHSELARREEIDAKIVFIARTMKAKLLTTDYNLAKMAEFQGVSWLNVHALARALRPELTLGEIIEIDLVKPGKEEGQAVGFLDDGSMVVVADARESIGRRVQVEVTSVLPSGGGKLVFAKIAQEE